MLARRTIFDNFNFFNIFLFSCGLTVLRSDGSQYDDERTITLTENKVEELCPKPTTTTPPTPAPTQPPTPPPTPPPTAATGK